LVSWLFIPSISIEVFVLFRLIYFVLLGWFVFGIGHDHSSKAIDNGNRRIKTMQLTLLLIAALLFAIGGLCMKFSDGLTSLWPSLGIFSCFCVGAASQAVAMRQAEMGSTYVFVLGVEAIAAFGLGAGFLGERINWSKGVALVLIVSGIALLDRNG
jgi:quaternary ammonium compound-resistance protein SugE